MSLSESELSDALTDRLADLTGAAIAEARRAVEETDPLYRDGPRKR